MPIRDWNRYRRQLLCAAGAFTPLSAQSVPAEARRSVAGARPEHLDDRTRELIALGAAVGLRCDDCITVHVESARRLGASCDQIGEAIGAAIAVNGDVAAHARAQ
jgi:AhpD family alkylhydroperoxidase